MPQTKLNFHNWNHIQRRHFRWSRINFSSLSYVIHSKIDIHYFIKCLFYDKNLFETEQIMICGHSEWISKWNRLKRMMNWKWFFFLLFVCIHINTGHSRPMQCMIHTSWFVSVISKLRSMLFVFSASKRKKDQWNFRFFTSSIIFEPINCRFHKSDHDRKRNFRNITKKLLIFFITLFCHAAKSWKEKNFRRIFLFSRKSEKWSRMRWLSFKNGLLLFAFERQCLFNSTFLV